MLNKYICMHKHIWGCMHTVTYGQILVGFPCLKMSANSPYSVRLDCNTFGKRAVNVH